ncbi:coiled-coil domain-containing protein 93-like protein [Leptotrombidium deliense]|uniref:Coiled-coil domain-containing protein 93 n=1 Tax=Leptotrombidium deliense TaxID=299467 RepID=A0A443S3V3_9ACAR|nr:coiled-coil domain-containing protein 93-like protein [Leptotrombidium deliense]
MEKLKKDQLNEQYIDLVEKQRLYYKAVKEFKEECRKNEQLIVELQKLNK